MPFVQHNLDKALVAWRDKGLALVGDRAEENVSGKVLNVRSGALLKDVQDHQQPEGPASFSVGTSLVYGKAWEKGFSRKSYVVRPRRAQALKIPIGADEFIFRLRAEIPAQTFASKAFLRPAVDSSKELLKKDLGEQIRNAKMFTPVTIRINLGLNNAAS